MEILYGLAGILFFIYLFAFILGILFLPLVVILEIIFTKRRNSTYANGLKRYLFSIIVYVGGAVALIESNVNLGFNNFIFVFHIIPWLYAIWFFRHTYKWRKKIKNIEAYDKLQLLNAPHPDRILLDTYPKKKFILNHLINHELATLS